MPERIKGRLKVLYPKANLSKKRLGEISARLATRLKDESTDEEVDTVIEDANAIYPFEEIAKDDDRRATFEHKVNELEKKVNQTEDPKPDYGKDKADEADKSNPEDKGGNETNSLLKNLLKTQGDLMKEIAELKSSKVKENKTQLARKAFDEVESFKALDQDIKDHYFSQIDVDSETPLDEQIASIETMHNRIVQKTSDSQSYAGAPPIGSDGKQKPSDEEVEELVDNL